MDETTTRPAGWQRWAIIIAAIVGIGAPLVALAMGVMTGARWIDWRTSLGLLQPLSWAAMAGLGIALVMMILLALRRRWGSLLLPLVTVVVAAGFVGVVAYNFGKTEVTPFIHDVTTDVVDPPQFETLSLREDNFETVPVPKDPDLEPLDMVSRWRLLHLRYYPDIQPVTVPATVPETIEAARVLAEDRGWEIAAVAPATGRLEATDTVSIYRFKDDVVLRVTPDPNGEGSIVHMRSVSRVGVSDLGVNAERVRGFLADLQARLG